MRAKETKNVKKVLAILLSVVMIFTAVSFSSPGAFAASGVTFENVDLMMIYNPLRYQEEPTGGDPVTAAVSTGDMSGTIVQAASNEGAFGMQSSGYNYSMNARFISQRLKVYDLPGKQTNALGPKTLAVKNALQKLYLAKPTVNQTRSFYIDGVARTFECLAVGTTTVIWVEVGDSNYTSVKNMASNLVSEMDSKVVANDHNYFGMGRFYDPANNNLINAICHQIEPTGGVMGYFDSSDLLTDAQAALMPWQVTTGMPIIHVNSASAKVFGASSICSTLAHEYQHLIATTETYTNTKNSGEYMEAWINETMAMEAIELSYPGDCIGSNYLYVYNTAQMHRDGQSLYNFATTVDIGAYGQAFLFAQYLEKYFGVEKFKEFHTYWRTNANQTEGNGLSAVAPASNKTEVDSVITYPSSLKTTLGTDEFMSKLALCYNVAVIKQDASGKYGLSYSKGGYTNPQITKINPLLYRGTNADIEGGGRILVKPKNGTYVVPDDADPNLIYVGFSADGKNITLDPTFAVPQAAQYKVTYEDLAAGTEKPATASTLPAEKKYAEGATVTVEPNLTTTETTYNGKEGTWTFDGWNVKTPKGLTITGTNPKTFTMPGEDVVLVPKWTFTEKAEKFTVKYDWGTVPTDVVAASELPVDTNEYDTAEAAKAAMDTTFDNTTTRPGTQGGKTGNWTFSGWTPSVEGQVVTFTGSWAFKADNPSVTNVTVTPATATVDAGDSQAFTAKVTGVNLTDNTVTWTVEGAKSADTKIDASGNLVVGADETATDLTVRATSKQDTTKSGTAAVVVVVPQAPTPTVTKVTVTPDTVNMEVGTNKTFAATVTGENSPSQAVSWTVEGAKSADTKIDENGKLVIGEDETATTLTVRATSAQDNTKSGTATVTVTKPEPPKPTVIKVTVAPATATMEVGTNKTFTATVTGENSPSQAVSWTVEGAKSADTKIDENGKLVIGEDETATTLTVRATSDQDNTKSGTATVTVTKPTVTKVTVAPATATMEVGTNKTFTATVTGENSPNTAVTWTVEGAKSADTKIDENGKLVIGEDETATTLKVKATSVEDPTKSGTATVTVTKPAPPKPTVTKVTVTPDTVNMEVGTNKTFAATVTGENSPSQAVSWTVEGAKSADTKIDENGKLVIGEDETATTLTVRATSVEDTTKSGIATVTVTKPEPPKPTVIKVTVAPATATMEVGTNKTFTATVTGENSPSEEVTWTVEGAKSANTKIDANGKLIIGEDETATTLTVKATSVEDPTKSGTATVTVTQKADPGEDPQPTPVDRIPVDNDGDGEADVYVEVETRNDDGTCIGVDGNKYFDPDGDGIFVKWLAPVLLDPPVKKVVTGKDAFNAKGFFTFVMMGMNGAPMPAEIPDMTSLDKGSNTLFAKMYGEGKVEFGNITYTVDLVPNKGDSITFTYYLGELNTGNESYTYDTTEYTMTVTITNNGNELVKTVKYATSTGKVVDEMTFTNIYNSPAVKPEDPAKPEDPTKPGTPGGKPDTLVPNTGDTTDTTLYAALLLAGLGIAVATMPRKKEDEE